MASNESTCSNKGTLSEVVDVTLRNTDDKPELENNDLEDQEKSKTFAENAENVDNDLHGESNRIRKLTEKGEEENVRRLKQKRTNALSAVTRKRTDMSKLMNNENNLEVVKYQLTELDRLCQHFEDCQNEYLYALSSPEDKEEASVHFGFKESDIFEYRKMVVNWITACEQRLSDQFDNLSGRHTNKSRSSRISKNSSLSSRAKEKARVAELIAERSMLKQRLELKVAEEEYRLDLKIAKAQARERVLAEIEQQDDDRNLNENRAKTLPPTLPVTLPTPPRDVTPSSEQNVTPSPSRVTLPEPKRERLSLPFLPGHEDRGVDNFKAESENYQQLSPLDPHAPEFLPLPHGIKTERRDENSMQQVRDEKLLKEVFKMQQEQIQRMVSSQHQLATVMTLPQPEVPKFKGDPMDYKTFIMAFDARVQSKVISSADRLYYLDQHLIGEPKELIGGCLHIAPDEGYPEARRLLEKEYGDAYKVSTAYMQKLLSWPVLKYDDGPALKRFSIFLTKCHKAMKTIAHLAVLDHAPNLQAIVLKLPANLQTKWRETVVRTRRKDNTVAGFGDLVEFVEYAAETANDPVYGKDALIKTKLRSSGVTEDNKKFSPSKPKSSSFATNLSTAAKPPSSHGAGFSRQNVKSQRCPLCERSHDLDDCEAFQKKTVNERRAFLVEKALCFACYGDNHHSRSCRKKRVCKRCPTLLHLEGFTVAKREDTSQKQASEEKATKVTNGCVDITQQANAKDDILLQTILPVVITQKGTNKSMKTYAFYDNGSAGCFLTESLKRQLEASSTKTTLQLGTMHGQSLVESAIVKDLVVSDLKGKNPIELPRTYTRQEIPADHKQIPTSEIVSRIEHLKEIAEEIPAYDPELEIGLLIGSNCPKALVPLKVVPNDGDGPFALQLSHGWTVSGPVYVTTEPATRKLTAHRITVREVESVKEIITPKSLLNLFELDFSERASSNIPEDVGYSQEDRKFLSLVHNDIRHAEGHYEIPLPFRQQDVKLPNNREQALKRVLWQKKKMTQNDKYRRDYVAFINDMVDKGYAEKVPNEALKTEDGKAWYVPHHGVYHPKKPEKIRVVFDCSAKFGGTSLNEQLLQGPDLTNSLVGVLTRFRQEPVAFMGDIEAMFYQVRVPVYQRDFMRFLWWPDGDLNAELAEYRMTVHPFGAVSSPSCSNFALRNAANENEEEIGNAIANTLRRNFYVDDCLRSVGTEAEGKDQIDGLRKACAKGGFRLTKFISNRRSVLESIPEEERSKDVKTLDLNYDDLPVERALGVQWCVESDTFGFRIVVKEKPLTRRGILSTVSSIYDPLGFAAPFTLTAKKLLQDLCREEKLGWDDELPDPYLKRWEKWRNELPLLERMIVPRCVKPSDFGQVESRQLHIFSDASSVGYGSVVYQRLCDNEGRIHCSFMIGKARLAPIKTVTIPRLELTAATVSVRLGEMMKKELDDKPDTVQYHTDSTTVLRYIGNDQKRFQVFVANRVQLIRNFSDPSQWRYVETKENPADDASRGLDAKTMIEQQRWLRGPEFLWQPEKEWPVQPPSFGELSTEDPEVKKQVNACATAITDQAPEATVTKLLQHFSDWYRLKKAVAVFLRVKTILQERRLKSIEKQHGSFSITNDKANKLNEDCSSLTVQELEEAEHAIIRLTQSQNFDNELKSLYQASLNEPGHERTRPKKGKTEITKTSSLYRLDPFVDGGLLRVGGRLNYADIPEESKHPIILPRKSHVTTLIIRHTHEQLGHAGRGHVLARLREKYWIVGANSAVRQYISSCVTCRRTRAPPQDQKMADLPRDRLTPAPPFTYVGVDFFGPYVAKQGRKESKRYGVMFTCLVSRAVHIEVANSLETDCFLNVLRRFIARRGPVREIRCDNGTNFVGAKRELREVFNEMNPEEITEKLRHQQIDWKFNPPAASHMGGVWERQIRTARRLLDTLLREHGSRLDDESLHTLLCEVESIINSRPLTAISSDANDPIPLSPNQILTMKTSIVLPPPGKFQRNDVYMRRRWRRVQYLCNLFWSRWRREYLPTLQQRPKWNKERRNLSVNDIVLIKDENAARNVWPMGVVTSVERDSKDLVRSVVLRTAKAELRRPVAKLVLLLAADDKMDADHVESEDAEKP